LTSAEKNYPQIDLELGAIAWAFERLDAYVYGTTVQVFTDHKPLMALSKKQIGDLSIRQQRMFARLMRYDYEVEYVSEKLMGGPDALSKAPQQLKSQDESSPQNPVAPEGEFEQIFISELTLTDLSDPLIKRIQNKAVHDQQYQALVKSANEGFPVSTKAELGEYWSVKDDTYVSQNLAFRNRELIVPKNCRQMVLNALHRAHQGVRAMICRAQGNVFWTGIAKDIQKCRESCLHCQTNLPQQQKEPMLSIDVPSAPGLSVASDYFQMSGKEYVLFVDVFSLWTEYFQVNSRRPSTLINKLRNFMSRNGIPRTFYADEGSAYESAEFKQFCEEWGIKLITCSGEYPQGNGTAEAAVKRVKKWLAGADNEDEITRAILTWHQTPINTGRPTPAQLHLGRNVRDEITTQVEQSQLDWNEVKLWKQQVKNANATIYASNKHAKQLPNLKVGDHVFVSMHGKWRRAVTENEASRPRSYQVRLKDTGSRVERNRIHLRPDKTCAPHQADPNLFYFSADPKSEDGKSTRMQEEIPTDPGDKRRDRHEPVMARQTARLDENPRNEEQQTSQGPRPKPKKTRLDPEAEYLKKQQQTRCGRETKIIQRYDPSN
jgi:hypothetical protein